MLNLPPWRDHQTEGRATDPIDGLHQSRQTIGMDILRETWRFVFRNWWQLLLLVPGALAITILHEAAHALAVLAQGGTLLEFVFIPTGHTWGHVSYEFAPGVAYSSFAISIAPYLLWFGMAVLVSIIARFRFRWPFCLGCFVLLWAFVLPLGDIANASVPWAFAGNNNDFFSAFGAPSALAQILHVPAGLILLVWGWSVQHAILRDESLSIPAYLLLFVNAGALCLVALQVVPLVL